MEAICKFKITKLISFFTLCTDLKEIKFLVTGSAGFVGRQVAKNHLNA